LYIIYNSKYRWIFLYTYTYKISIGSIIIDSFALEIIVFRKKIKNHFAELFETTQRNLVIYFDSGTETRFCGERVFDNASPWQQPKTMDA